MPLPLLCLSLRRIGDDFARFWAGQTISKLGSAFSTFALPLLIYTLTHSSLNLAFTVVATVLPYVLFGLVIGAWVDRTRRKRLMIVADLARALIVASIPVASLLGMLSVWWIYAVAFASSTLTICFDAADFAAVPSLVGTADLVRANGRLQAGYSAARVLGPLLAGALLLVVAVPLLLLCDAASFLLSAVSLALVTTSFNAKMSSRPATSIRQDIVAGLRFIGRTPPLRYLMLLLFGVNFLVPTTTSQLVLFAKQWLAASNTQVSLLYAGNSLGTVLFALLAGRLRARWPLGTVAVAAMVCEGLLTVTPALTHAYGSALLWWTLRGGVDVLFVISTYSLTQALVPSHMLGRVITFMRVLTWSTGALGAVLGALVIQWTGSVGLVYEAIGTLTACCAAGFWLTPLRTAGRAAGG